MPLIDEKMRLGVRLKDIAAHLNERGFEVTIYDLRKARFKWLKAQKQNPRAPDHAPGTTAYNTIDGSITTPESSCNVKPIDRMTNTSRVANKGDLARLRRETEIDLNELARLGKQHP